MNDRCFCGFKKELNKSSCCVQCFIGKGHGPLCKKIVCNNTEDNNKITKVIHKTGPNTNNFDKLEKIFDNDKKYLFNNLIYYNDNDCDNIIKNNFPIKIYLAFKMLVPPAFKSDIFRYCIIYLKGGIYLDLTNSFIKKYLIDDTIDIILVKDRPYHNLDRVQISFIAAKPKLNFFKFLLLNICNNVLKKKYGIEPLDITGPRAFMKYFSIFFKMKKLNMGTYIVKGLDNKNYKIQCNLKDTGNYEIKNLNNETIIRSKILGENIHREILNDKNRTKNYDKLWHEKRIFL
jgi:mannosyltransferase OCH1-like enzyme